ncbi:MAG: lipopolysaccharide core heptose(I) kinase RfaP [Gammaproteobacteria bacterium]|nr:lipopolysaccharide core heptose(I) kinase RfaP [Gammaproteobacteria bacterium]
MKRIYPDSAQAVARAALDSGWSVNPVVPVKLQRSRQVYRLPATNGAMYVKVHSGVGWAEIFKNLVSLRWPVRDAGPEWRALTRARRQGIRCPEPLALASRGRHPARKRSVLVTRALPESTAVEVAWPRRGALARRHLVVRVARLARALHDAGINHRDLYLGHLRLGDGPVWRAPLYLLDLHRAQLRRRVPLRWRCKDLAALALSALRAGELSAAEATAFLRAYGEVPGEPGLWQAVRARLLRDLRRHRQPPPDWLGAASGQWQRRGYWRRAHGAGLPASLPRLLAEDRGRGRLDDGHGFHELKRDRRTRVYRWSDGRCRLLVKVYPLSGLARLRALGRASRARRAWRAACDLRAAGIGAPRPLLLYERGWGLLPSGSVLVSEFVDGANCGELLETRPGHPVRVRLVALLRRLRGLRFVHGDLKASNLLVRGGEPWLIDLDRAHRWRKPWGFRRAFARDLRRFSRNWQARPELRAWFDEQLRSRR